MKVKEIHLQGFKRFADLRIEGIASTVKLVVLLGPNGCGKSSLFDAMNIKSYQSKRQGYDQDSEYYHHKASDISAFPNPTINFHDNANLTSKSIYIRTAYRNDPVAEIAQIAAMPSMLLENRFTQMIHNDAATTGNFQRLVSNAIQRAFLREDRGKTLGDFQDETLGEIQKAMGRLFSDLVLKGLGDPLEEKTFTFDKSGNVNFPYKNLSGGEKAAFDLLLDIFVKRNEYDDTVFCIDEPEAHMNPRLQGGLLEEIFRLINDKSQLWIATHAIGMMRKALELHTKHPNTVAFLDFGERDFDRYQVIIPSIPNREFWEKTHKVALDDLGSLVAPEKIILCEGKHGIDGFDAECYNQIFSTEFPNTKFISVGGKSGLENYIQVVSAVAKGAEIFGLRDRDNATDFQVEKMETKGIRVLGRHEIENYLLCNDVLHALCTKFWPEEQQEKSNALIQLRNEFQEDQAKAASQKIFQQMEFWGSPNIGSQRESFLRDTLAPLIKPGMPTYAELKTIIFGSDNAPPT